MPTRLAVFTLVDWSFKIVQDWATAAGHEIALLVTQPPRVALGSLQYSNVTSRETVVMVVPKVELCQPTLAELDVDLAIVFTFLRVPESVATLPCDGCVNAAPRPFFRPIEVRMATERCTKGIPCRLGATLHYLTPEFDAGPGSAQASCADS